MKTKHEKNILIKLPEQIKLKIEIEAEQKTSKLMDNIFSIEKRVDQIMFLRNAYRELLEKTESDKWFRNEATLKDFEMIQQSYDKELAEKDRIIKRQLK